MSLSGLITGSQLDAETFPPLSWSVPGVLPEGFGLLSAKPKAGKSWLVLQIGLAVAAGGSVLGVAVERRPVLYMALEDGWRRLRDRSQTLLNGSPMPAGIAFLIEAESALNQAQTFIDENPGCLVILDTLGTVKPPRKATEDAYGSDYRFSRQLKGAAAPGVTFLAVHHNRKADADDFLDTVSGTHGITGAADFVMVLDRKDLSQKATLHITGRDVTEASYAMLFNEGRWTADGDSLSDAAVRVREKQLGDNQFRVLRLVEAREATTASDVADHLAISNVNARQILSRLAENGRIERTRQGVYTHVTTSQPHGPGTSPALGCDGT